MYIGELCRYLLAQPKKPTDTQHRITRIAGNGLRPQIWTEFKTRFNISDIFEFYGSGFIRTCIKSHSFLA